MYYEYAICQQTFLPFFLRVSHSSFTFLQIIVAVVVGFGFIRQERYFFLNSPSVRSENGPPLHAVKKASNPVRKKANLNDLIGDTLLLRQRLILSVLLNTGGISYFYSTAILDASPSP
ncbi:hypothetical protein EBR25_06545 [bacterium]|nr:hypothetical protein [bacterium]